MKEVSNLPESLCGLTQYYGDRYVGGQCVYKKCIDECVEGQYEFTFEGQKYTRKRYCCNNDDLCNGRILFSPRLMSQCLDAVTSAKLSWTLLISIFGVLLYFLV